MDRFLLYFTGSGGTGGDARRSIAFAGRWDRRGPVAPLLLRPGGTGGGPSLHCFCAPAGRAGARRSIAFAPRWDGRGPVAPYAFAARVGRAGAPVAPLLLRRRWDGRGPVAPLFTEVAIAGRSGRTLPDTRVQYSPHGGE